MVRFGYPEGVDEKTLKSLRDTISPMLPGVHRYNEIAFNAAITAVKDLVLAPDKDQLKAIDQLRYILAITLSEAVLPGYSTLDSRLIAHVEQLIGNIESYVAEQAVRRPLNVLMLASPGAGKSHFIRCIANRLGGKKVEAITFNMATMQSNDDLIPPLDQVRNIKVEDKVPLLFLDEFDSNPQYIPMLLPLLWDGMLNVGQRELKLGKVIIVLAGSDPSLPGAMEHARSMRGDAPITNLKSPKLVDLFSRINGGVIEIPPFYDPAHGTDRRADKACIATTLIRHRFRGEISKVPRSLLHFVAETKFRYGVRSIAHFVDSIPDTITDGTLAVAQLGETLEDPSVLKASSLAYHVIHDDQAFGISEQWKKSAKVKGELVIDNERVRYLPPFEIADQRPEMFDYFLYEMLGSLPIDFSNTQESE
ncbi:ATP-binding protein [Rhodopirellula sp. SWK7]|uniref:ATP-binding protein n=1 Tax=Rhodopirellula sp. SWK7 TaxID=595460 RepID=UPI001181A05A|nr:ATP-binding protein [Rhodopirellula sp. SWK7]